MGMADKNHLVNLGLICFSLECKASVYLNKIKLISNVISHGKVITGKIQGTNHTFTTDVLAEPKKLRAL